MREKAARSRGWDKAQEPLKQSIADYETTSASDAMCGTDALASASG